MSEKRSHKMDRDIETFLAYNKNLFEFYQGHHRFSYGTEQLLAELSIQDEGGLELMAKKMDKETKGGIKLVIKHYNFSGKKKFNMTRGGMVPECDSDVEITFESEGIFQEYWRNVRVRLGLEDDGQAHSLSSITFVRPPKNRPNQKPKIIVNKVWQKPLNYRQGKAWRVLYEIAQNAFAEVSSSKSVYDYFNSNKSCALYTSTNLVPRSFLKKDGDRLSVIDGTVDIEVIEDTTYKKRCKMKK